MLRQCSRVSRYHTGTLGPQLHPNCLLNVLCVLGEVIGPCFHIRDSLDRFLISFPSTVAELGPRPSSTPGKHSALHHTPVLMSRYVRSPFST